MKSTRAKKDNLFNSIGCAYFNHSYTKHINHISKSMKIFTTNILKSFMLAVSMLAVNFNAIGAGPYLTKTIEPPSTNKLSGISVTKKGLVSDFAGNVQFNPASYIFDENAGTVSLDVRYTGPDQAAFTIDYASIDGTAVAGSDYIASSGTLSFSGTGGEILNINIAISDDTILESTEAFQVQLSNISEPTINVGSAIADIDITDNDSSPTNGLSVSDFSVDEAAGTADFVVTYNGAAVQDAFTVDYNITDGTAISGSDYSATLSGQISFPAGTVDNDQQSISITISDDSLIEGDENLDIQLSNLSTTLLNILDADGIGTITNNDSGPTNGLSVSDFSVDEAAGTADFVVTYNGATVQDAFTIDYNITDGSALSGSDYSATLSGQISFPAGTADNDQQTVTINLNDDTVIEGDEDLNIQLSNLSTTLITILDGDGVGTITDNDSSPTTGLSVSDFSIDEAAGTADFVVTYNGATVQDVFTVDYTITDGTTTSGTDYSATLSGQISFPAGTTDSDQQSVSVTISDDSFIEGDENLNIQLSSLSTTLINILDADGVGTITDNDSSPTTGLSVSDFIVDEAAGTVDFVVTYNGATVQDAFTVDYTITDGTTTSGTDYSATLSGQLSFPANTTNGAQQSITVTITDDSDFEGDETLNFDLSNLSLSYINLVDPNGVGTIQNNDPQGVISFQNTGIVVTEGTDSFIRFTVNFIGTLNALEVALVDYATIDLSAISPDDFTADTGTISFTSVSQTSNIDIPINDDSLIEPSEDFSLTLSNIQALFDVRFADGQPTNTATATINDNDSGAGNGLSIDGFTVDEDALTANFIVRYNGNTVQDAFTVDYTITDGTAILSTDYNATTTGQLIFPALTTNGDEVTVSVSIVDDLLIEGTEDINFELSNLSTSLVNLLDTNATGSINDNDATPTTGVSAVGFSVNEDVGTTDFVIAYSGGTIAEAFTVDYTITDGTTNTSDYTVVATGQLSFPAMTADGNQQTITVTINDDTLLEGSEYLEIELSNLSTPIINIVNAQATGTILDNETSDASTGVSVADIIYNEDAGTVDFEITYNGPTVQDAFTVDYSLTDNTTIFGSDYTGTALGQLNFPPLTTNGSQQTVSIGIVDDTLIENTEDLSLQLFNLSLTLINIVDGNAVGTINDNDSSAAAGLTASGFSLDEGFGTANFTITYNGPTIQDSFTVDYLITDGSALSGSDYSATLSGQITFPAMTADGNQLTVAVTLSDDALIENDEDLNIELSNLSTSLINILGANATGTIVDNDSSPTTGLSALDFTVDENTGTANFIVSYSGASVQDAFTVDYAITDGSAISGMDYTTTLTGQLSFPALTAGGDQQSVSVTITDDLIIEDAEDLQIQLSNLSITTINLVDDNATGTINDNDSSPTTGLTATGFSVNEGSGTGNFVVTYNGATTQNAFTVDYTISDGSAVSGSDYSVVATGQLTFPANTTDGDQQLINISIIEDAIIEGDEDLNITLSNLSTSTINLVVPNATATILDNDLATPTTGVSVSDFSVNENAGTANFIVTYSGNTVQDSFTVDYTISDDTAIFGSDYNGTISGQIVFPALSTNGETQSIAITINNDNFIEANETLDIQLSNLSTGLINIVDADGTGTIIDDDNSPTIGIDFQSSTITVTEGDSGDTVNATFTLTFNGLIDSGETIEVDYLVNDGTAFNLTDFNASPTVQTAIFNSTDSSIAIDVPIVNDDNIEITEQFTFNLLAIRSNVGINILNNTATGIIDDDDSGTISITGFNSTENNGTANFAIQFTGGTLPGGFTLDYSISDITTTLGVDYTVPFTTGSISFSGNNNETELLPIYVTDDAFIEPDEDLNVVISNLSSSSITFSNTSATGTIVNDDSGLINVTGFSVNEVNGTTHFEVTYSGDPIQGGFTVDYQISDITATNGSDYDASPASGTLNFSGADGEVIQIPIDIFQDSIIEGDERLEVNLTSVSPTLITLLTSNAIGEIIDIDHQPNAIDDAIVVFQGQTNIAINVLTNDDYGLDGPAGSNPLQIVSSTSNGTLIFNNNGTSDPLDDYFVYNPSPSFTGNDSFSYRITDSNGSTDTAVVNLYVEQDNLREPFAIRYTETLNGNYTMIANNVLSRNSTGNYNGTDGNHDFNNNVFVDIDSNASTFNSTRANLVNPEPSLACLNIKRAYIYWAAADKAYGVDGFGLTTGTGNPADEPAWNFNQVMLMLPGQSNYTTITADDVIYRGRDDLFQNDPYVCVKDITAEVNALASPFGNYQVGNVKATERQLHSHTGSNTGTSGGWQIVFVYENSTLEPKNVTLFDGYVHTFASNGAGETEFNFSGFETIPNGNVNAGILIGALEGDQDLSGDQLQIFDTGNNWTNLSTPMRDQNNFFNSRITLNNTDFINRVPASTNTLGYDATIFELNNTGNTLIDNDQSFVRFKITTDQESYGLYLMGMSVDVYQPSLGALSLTVNGTNNFNAGDIAPMTLSITNTGNDDIVNLVISTILPPEAEFDNASSLPTGVTHNYDSATRELQFFVADGNVDIGDSFDINFDLRLSPRCYFLETACSASFDLQATAVYNGELNPDTITTNSSGTTDSCGIGSHDPTTINIQQPAAANWLTPANGLNRTVACDDVVAYNDALSLEPVVDACTFSFNKTSGPFVPSPTCPSQGTYTNTWTFTDACGRTSSVFTQVITVEDTVAPVFNETLPDSFAAYDNVPPAQTITANDNCDLSVPVTFTETYIGDNTSTTYTIVRTWSTSDCAGNSISHTQYIYVTELGLPIGLSINDITVDEDAGTATLEVLNTGDNGGSFTVNYVTNDGTAQEPGDYTNTTGTLNFLGNNNETVNIVIPINDDNIIEPSELFEVLLTTGTNTPAINDDRGEVTINDNDASGSGEGISVADFSVNEGVGAADFVISYTGPAVQESFTVEFSVSDVTAINPIDYNVITPGIFVTFPSGTTDGDTQVVSINIIDDVIIEPSEDLDITLSNISNAAIAMVDDTAIGTILDNDASGPGQGIAVADITVNENVGTTDFIVQYTGLTVQEEFTVDFVVIDGSATNPADYAVFTAGTSLTFPAGTSNGDSQIVSINVVDDALIEPTEDLNLNLSNISIASIAMVDGSATATIIDNDANGPGQGISVSNFTVNENIGTANFVISYTGSTVQNAFTVDFVVTDGSATNPADYTVLTAGTSVGFPSGTTNGSTQIVTINIIDDLIIEPAEDINITISNISDTDINMLDDTGIGTIIDNDASGPGDGIAVADFSVNENAGTADFVVTYTGPTVQNSFTVDFSVSDGSAVFPTDYFIVTPGSTLTFPDGTINGTTQVVTVGIIDDFIIESTEDLNITISNISNSAISMVDNSATGSIVDNDGSGPGQGISVADFSVNENAGTADFVISYTGPTVQDGFTLNFLVSDVTATNPLDYNVNNPGNTITFPPATANGASQTVTINIVDDLIIESSENLDIVLSNISNGSIAMVDANAIGTIVDNDSSGPGEGIAVSNFTVNEDVGTVDFVITYTGPTVQDSFSVDFTIADGSATNPDDYTVSTAGSNITFPANTTNGITQVVTINVVDDLFIEANENLSITLSNISNSAISMVNANATGTIVDNDSTGSTGIAFDATDVTVDEAAGTMTFNVTLTGNVQGGFTVDYATADGSAVQPGDYTDTSGTLTFTGTDGESHPITVPVIDDDIIEPTENLTVSLSGLSTGLITINGPSTANGNITDNDATGSTGIAFDATDITVDEAAGTMTFNVTLTGNVQGGFTVDYATADGSAVQPGDYTDTSGTLTFTGTDGESHPITVPVIDDDIIEPTENLTVSLSGLSTGLITINGPSTANGNITDNDATGSTGIAFDATDITVDEAAGTMTFNVTLTGNVQGGFTVDYATADGSAVQPGDYTDTTGTLTFTGTDGESHPITVPVIDDDIIEPTENLTVSLSGLSTGLITINGPSTANGNITDNDATGSTGIAFDATDVTVDEAAGTMTFNVTLTGNVQGGFTVDYATADGSAVQPGDYTDTSGTLTFTGTDGESHPITVPVIDDDIIEPTEDLTVSLSGLSTGLITINGPSTANGNITDNDATGSTGIAFDATDITVDEAAGTMTFNVTLTGNVQGGFTVDYATADGSAVQPGDYTDTSGTLTFTGTDGESHPITVPVIDDDIIEPTEDLTVSLSGLSTGLITINGPSTANGNITDNDATGSTGIAFDATDITVDEAAGTMTFNVTLTGNVQGGFTVDYATADGSAVQPGDYTDTSGTLTFTGTDGESHPITVPVIDDDIIEPTEDLTVSLSGLSTGLITINGPSTANGNITDNDATGSTGIAFDATDVTVDEAAGTMTFNVTLTGNVQGGFTVDYATADGSAVQPGDYTDTSGTLTFTGTDGESHPITVPVIDDDIIEPTEDLTVSLSGLSTGLITINGPSTANGNITDNDATGSTGIAFDATDITVDEAAGTMTFNVTLTGNVQGGFTVDYATADGSAVQPGDYTDTSGTLTFTGTDGESHPITVPVIDDDIIEPTENLTVSLSGLSTGLITINGPSTANGNITDNDATGSTGIAFDATDITVDEAAGTMTFNVTLTGNVQGGFTVDYATADGSAVQPGDYTDTTGTLTFTGTDGESHPITVPVIDDDIIEPTENLTVSLSGLSTGLITINGPSTANGNITDNDATGSTGIAFDATDVTVDEAAGTMTFNVTLTGNVQGGFTVDYATADGSAVQPGDYTDTSGTLTFTGTDGESHPITVPVIDDDIIEPTEDLTVSLSGLSTGLITINGPSTANGNITDNDATGSTGIAFDATDITVDEAAGTMTFNVTLTGNVQGGFTVDYATADGSAVQPGDYTDTSGTLTFTGTDGESHPITVPVIDDDIIEPTEDLTVSLSGLSTGLITINGPSTANGNITDNDATGSTGIAFDATDVTVDEAAGTMTFNVTLTGNVQGGFTVDYATADGSAVQPGDYTDTSGTLTFTGTDGESHPITVPVIDDDIIEPTEDLTVSLSGLSTGLITINGPSTANGNITDNDNIPGVTGISFDNDAIVVNEADGTATVNVLLTGNVQGGFTIDFTTNDNTAVQPGDYTDTSGTLTFTGTDGEMHPITVPIIDDDIIEATEQLFVDLSNLSTTLIAINDAQATVDIIDNDNIPGVTGISFDNDAIVVNEADGTATVNVLLTGNVQGGFTIDFTTNDNTAVQPGDYTTTAGTLTFTGTDGEMHPITVPIIDDDIIEATEQLFVDLSNLSTTLIAINDAQATVDIIDNDNIPGVTGISFDATDITVDEAAGTMTFNVTLTGNVQGGFTVDYATADGSAVQPGDYTDTSGTLTFTGTDGESHPITVPVIDDDIIEPTEDLTVSLSGLSTGLITINGPSTANGNITDNDNIPGVTGISFDNDAIVVNEADGTATVNVLLTGNVQGGFTIDFTTNDNTAVQPGDYTTTAGTLTFTGTDGEMHPITVPIIDDDIIEATEQLFVDLSNLSTTLIAINDAQATVDIIDNDNIPGVTGISFDNDAIVVNEADGTATVNVLLTGNVQGGFTIDFTTNDNTAVQPGDYTTTAGTLTFTGTDGEMHPITVPIIDDDIIEATEQLFVDLSNLSTTLIAINDAQATVDIIDNDNIPGVTGISFDATDITVDEAAGTMTFNVTLTGNVQGGFTVDYATADGSAVQPGDYTDTSGTLTFTGTDGESHPITVPVIDDDIIEPTEDLTVSLSGLSTGLITINGPSTANGNITDNDNIPGVTGISFDNDAIVVNEADGTATVNVLLTGNVQGGFTIDFTTNDNTAVQPGDYTDTSGTLTFTGTDGEMHPITVPIIDDDIIEATEQLFVDLSNLSTTLIAINDAQATVDIIDNDNIPGVTGISFDNDAIVVNEADGTATVNVLLTGNVQGGFTIDFTTNDNTAVQPGDYTTTAGTLTFTGTDGEMHPITVPIIDDDIIEATEQLFVDLSNLSTTLIAINDAQATVDIIDNDNIPGVTGISFDATDITVDEAAGTMTFNVTLTGNVQGGFTVDYATADGSAVQPGDYTDTSGTLTFTGTDGESHPITVPVIDDDIIEPTEDLTVSLSGLSTGLITINGPSTANGNITDNDNIPGVTGISFDNDAIVVNEADGTATVNVLLTGNVQGGFTIDFTTNDNTAVQPGDYTTTAGTLTFTGTDGEMHPITVPIIDDDIIEATEQLFVDLSNLSTTLIAINDAQATVDIIDNDNIPGVTGLSINDVTVNEHDGTATLTVTLTGQFQDAFTVEFTTQDDTATANEDYTLANGSLSFVGNDGETQTITIPILEDYVIEDAENFNAVLSNVSNTAVPINDDTGVVTIIDNEFRDPSFEDITIICGDEIPPVPELGDIGGCSEPEVVFTEDTIFVDDTDDYMIERTWTVTDECGGEDTFTQTIFVMQPTLEEVYIDICVLDDPIDLVNYIPESFDKTGTFVPVDNGLYVNNTQFVPYGLEEGEYTVHYSMTEGTCKYYVDFIVTVDSDCVPCDRDKIEISKTVTPNGDMMNDVFEIKGVEYCDFRFDVMIFNRWGDKVYEVENYQNDWDGFAPDNAVGRSGKLPAGTYYYIIKIADTELEPLNGYIYLNTDN